MLKRRFTPSPAMVVSLIALFIALGGTSYAAITALPKNSVGTAQIKNGAVTAAKINGATVKVVGSSGAPGYQGSWGPAAQGDSGVSFFKDAFGVVHLQGSALSGALASHNAKPRAPNSGHIVLDTLFTLPAAYRPSGNLWFVVYGGGGNPAYVEVLTTGAVAQVFGSNTYLGLGDITFKAAS